MAKQEQFWAIVGPDGAIRGDTVTPLDGELEVQELGCRIALVELREVPIPAFHDPLLTPMEKMILIRFATAKKGLRASAPPGRSLDEALRIAAALEWYGLIKAVTGGWQITDAGRSLVEKINGPQR